MKYCTKCGCHLVDEARFCNACGKPVEVMSARPVASENPYASEKVSASAQYIAQSESSETKTEEDLRAEEQALLDRFSIGLKHERMAWKFVGIFYLIGAVFFIAAGLFLGIATLAVGNVHLEEYGIFFAGFFMYVFMGLMYLPVAIINLVMKNKLEMYRAKLYTDCQDGIGHFSVGSIIFCAFFNGVALVFNIVYFIQAKNNAAVIERIKLNQESYNSQM